MTDPVLVIAGREDRRYLDRRARFASRKQFAGFGASSAEAEDAVTEQILRYAQEHGYVHAVVNPSNPMPLDDGYFVRPEVSFYSLLSTIEQISRLMKEEHRRDSEFRLCLAASQLGDVAKYVTHDPQLNPDARPHGSSRDEIMAYGQALVQLMALALTRDVDPEEAVRYALENWYDADWRRAKAKGGDGCLEGTPAVYGTVVGTAFVDPFGERLKEMDGHILVTSTARPVIGAYTDRMIGIVTDHGGKMCHAANIAREHGLPCVVGTGNATERIQDGKEIRIESTPEHGLVYF